jgi:hypothetical protein
MTGAFDRDSTLALRGCQERDPRDTGIRFCCWAGHSPPRPDPSGRSGRRVAPTRRGPKGRVAPNAQVGRSRLRAGRRAPRRWSLRHGLGAAPLAILFQETLNRCLRFRIRPLADMTISENPATIDQQRGRPSPNAVAPPDIGVVILDHRITNSKLPRRGHNAFSTPLPGEFRRMHADDGQPRRFIPLVPGPQLRDHVLTVDSPVGPEFHQHDPPAEPVEREGATIDPRLPTNLGRRRSDLCALAGNRYGQAGDQRRREDKVPQANSHHGHPPCMPSVRVGERTLPPFRASSWTGALPEYLITIECRRAWFRFFHAEPDDGLTSVLP